MVTFYCREVQAELEEGDLKVPEETRSVLKLQYASFIVVNMFVRQSSVIFYGQKLSGGLGQACSNLGKWSTEQ